MSLQMAFPYSLFAVFAIIVKEIGIRNLRHLSLLLVLVLTGVYVDKADNICVVFSIPLMSIIP